MSDNKVIFINIDSYNGRSVEVKCDGNQTWHALAEEFVNFLKGMGFQVTQEDLADYFAEYKTDPFQASPDEVVDYWPFEDEQENSCCAGGCKVNCTAGGTDINLGPIDYDFADSAVMSNDINIGDITITIDEGKTK